MEQNLTRGKGLPLSEVRLVGVPRKRNVELFHQQGSNALWACGEMQIVPTRELQKEHLFQPGVEPVLSSGGQPAARYANALECCCVVDYADAHRRSVFRSTAVCKDFDLTASGAPTAAKAQRDAFGIWVCLQ